MALKPAQIKKIKALYKTGEFSYTQLAKRFKSSKTAIARACKGTDKGETAHLVKMEQTLAKEKRNLSGTDMGAIQAVAKKLDLQEQMNQDTVKKAIAINNSVTNASFKKVVDGSKKMEAPELHEHLKIAERAVKLATPKIEPAPVQNTLNIANMMSDQISNDSTNRESDNSILDASELAKIMKNRNLPISNREKLESMGLL